LDALQHALALSPGHPDMLFHMALALSRTGGREEAERIRLQLVQTDADLASRLDRAISCSASC
ncbi:MAG TPA: serine protease, partial [Methyloversatilis sp.]